MILYANGCSYTWGGGILENERGLTGYLDDPAREDRDQVLGWLDTQTWPYHLANHLDCEHVNQARGCGSNSRTVRTTLEYFEHASEPQDHLAIIQWTDVYRYEVFRESTSEWHQVKADSISPKVYNVEFDLYQHRLTDSEETFNSTWFSQVHALGNYFERRGIPYVFTAPTVNVLSAWQEESLAVFNWLGDRSDWFMNQGFDSYGPTGHLTPRGHQQAARFIMEKLND